MAGLYIHVPFCSQRCVYCDFYFVTGQRNHDSFVEAVSVELNALARRGYSEPLSTIYLGGGTPSLLAPDQIASILESTHRSFNTSGVKEVTIELNPEDTSPSYLLDLLSIGVNRVSLGVQSFSDDHLRFMHRCHDSHQATRALGEVAAAGFDSFTVDLIFGLPSQSVQQWESDLSILLSFDPPHVSTYALTIEEKTPLRKQVDLGLVNPAPDQTVSDHYQIAIDTLSTHGLDHYEISSFAKPHHRSRHNSQYWDHTNYLGVGPSSHSFWWNQRPGAKRWSNIRNLRKYLSSIKSGTDIVQFSESLDIETLGLERIMLKLRTSEGLDLDHLKCTYGIDLLSIRMQAIEELSEAGLIILEGNSIRLTDQGKHVCDHVTTRLLP